MKRIPLTQGQFALVDDDDFDWLIDWKWCATKHINTFYAIRTNSDREAVQMHVVVLERKLGSLTDGMITDHQDGNGLNNQRWNLREATHADNMRNQVLHRDSTSGFKGVSWDVRNQKWKSRIIVNRRQVSLGSFDDPVEAARAYDAAALIHFGEFAKTNERLGLYV